MPAEILSWDTHFPYVPFPCFYVDYSYKVISSSPFSNPMKNKSSCQNLSICFLSKKRHSREWNPMFLMFSDFFLKNRLFSAFFKPLLELLPILWILSLSDEWWCIFFFFIASFLPLRPSLFFLLHYFLFEEEFVGPLIHKLLWPRHWEKEKRNYQGIWFPPPKTQKPVHSSNKKKEKLSGGWFWLCLLFVFEIFFYSKVWAKHLAVFHFFLFVFFAVFIYFFLIQRPNILFFHFSPENNINSWQTLANWKFVPKPRK